MKKIFSLLIISCSLMLVSCGRNTNSSSSSFNDVNTASVSSTSISKEATTLKRQMEYLSRGLVCGSKNNGIYLSWRLLGNEDPTMGFDVYKNNEYYRSVIGTNYTDLNGTSNDTYIVVPQGEDITGITPSKVWSSGSGNGGGVVNQYAYLDVLFDRPEGGTYINVDYDDNNNASVNEHEYEYTANDMSVGDLDGDGDYELVVKWSPSNARDNSSVGVTSETILDAYDIDYNTGENTRLWRIHLGNNIRSGTHYNPFLVYDFDGDGKSELVVKTAPGSIDGTGEYVSKAGVSKDITSTDNSVDYTLQKELDGKSYSRGIIMDGPEYLTIFKGSTGKAITTINYKAGRDICSSWGDSYANRSERYLACVAYLNGVTPSIVMCRGYYTNAYLEAYDFDGSNLNFKWLSSSTSDKTSVLYSDGTTKEGSVTAYGQGAHSLTSADIDNDGYDEIVYGAAVIDQDGLTLASTGRGHGDALHVSDFDNDGNSEIFMVHEHDDVGVDITRYNTKTNTLEDITKFNCSGDVGRGICDNFDDSTNKAIFKISSIPEGKENQATYYIDGQQVRQESDISFINSALYWDGDLAREPLDGVKLAKYSATNGYSRFYFGSKDSSFPGVSTNNSSKDNACLTCDLLGDYREEAIFRLSSNTGIRIFTSLIESKYTIPTLMHDSQYRTGVASENVGYNQPPHTSYYLGSLALKKNCNYLNPKKAFTSIYYPNKENTSSKDLSLTKEAISCYYDTYISDGENHNNEEDILVGKATNCFATTTPGLKDYSKVGYMSFDLSKYKDKEITNIKLILNIKNGGSTSTELYFGLSSLVDYEDLNNTTIALRSKNTPLVSPFASLWPMATSNYETLSLDLTNVIDLSNNVKVSIYMFTSTRQISVASVENPIVDGPRMEITYKNFL